MTVYGCGILNDDCMNSMIGSGKYDNANLHLLMGATTDMWAVDTVGRRYAKNLLAKVPIPQAWYGACHDAYHRDHQNINENIVLSTVGYGNCLGDTLESYSVPDPNQQNQFDDDLVFDVNHP
jgi:hypothetical protein